MIIPEMRTYNYYSYNSKNNYGAGVLSQEPTGDILISINTTSIAVQDNIQYKDATYIGLTLGTITDKEVIDYDGVKLKVLYVNPKGRFKQVFLKEIK